MVKEKDSEKPGFGIRFDCKGKPEKIIVRLTGYYCGARSQDIYIRTKFKNVTIPANAEVEIKAGHNFEASLFDILKLKNSLKEKVKPRKISFSEEFEINFFIVIFCTLVKSLSYLRKKPLTH